MHHPTDRITHTTAFVTPVVEIKWLEREIGQWVHPMKDRSDDPSHHEETLLPRSYISLRLEREIVRELRSVLTSSSLVLLMNFSSWECRELSSPSRCSSWPFRHVRTSDRNGWWPSRDLLKYHINQLFLFYLVIWRQERLVAQQGLTEIPHQSIHLFYFIFYLFNDTLNTTISCIYPFLTPNSRSVFRARVSLNIHSFIHSIHFIYGYIASDI